MDWFTVDRKGLAALLERKGKEFVLLELIQNAWDERSSAVDVTLDRIPGTRQVRLTVRDDNPNGFSDLSHAFTLFAHSAKKGDAEKRGRFNLGEKLVLALCDEAEIASTTGTVRFDATGRHTKRSKTECGSVFTGVMKMTTDEMAACGEAVLLLLPPAHIRTTYNGEPLLPRQPLKSVTATLPTEVADADGNMRPSQRKTTVTLYEPHPGETPMLYEMGIQVVATGDRFHIDVAQKVPLNFDRDNVPPSYLAKVRALAVEAMQESLTTEDANSTWVRDALQRHGDDLATETVNRLVALRFGDKRVAYDPSDPEANSRAVAAGYTVVHGGQMSKPEWEAVRRTGAILPAGQVTPSPKPFSDGGRQLKTLDEADHTEEMREVIAYCKRVAPHLLGEAVDLEVIIANDFGWPFAGAYGGRRMHLNLARLGHKWFSGPLTAINDLLIHELGHHFSPDHLSSRYHDALTLLGARLADLALAEPKLFDLKRTRS